jgi:aspartate aminotransferase
MEIMVAQSYSKNLGLYGERVGAMVFVTTTKDSATRVMSQMKRIARALYSNPPTSGETSLWCVERKKESLLRGSTRRC